MCHKAEALCGTSDDCCDGLNCVQTLEGVRCTAACQPDVGCSPCCAQAIGGGYACAPTSVCEAQRDGAAIDAHGFEAGSDGPVESRPQRGAPCSMPGYLCNDFFEP
jgi:hypothetical protein